MFFGTKKNSEHIVLSIAGTNIEKVREIRFLGVILDDEINWKSHISHVGKKIAKSVFILNKVKDVLDYKSMGTLYCALVLPYISY